MKPILGTLAVIVKFGVAGGPFGKPRRRSVVVEDGPQAPRRTLRIVRQIIFPAVGGGFLLRGSTFITA